ncbi:zinc-ribbon domain-containing protein, partial [Candidatus Bathyarchaeota archaeon]|nr:zinc-ribbon domain-containing protein [Candidatus Bathyarchaeota archaeon]
YDANTGEILVGETIQYEPAPDYQPLPKRTPPPTPADASEKSFCVFCGQKLANPGARFCPNCGSEIS